MTTGPGDEVAARATGRGRLRASDADREQVIDTLKAAFVQSRLTRDELDARVGQALASRTYEELAAIAAGIPAVLIQAQPPLEAARAHVRKPAGKKVVAWSACVIIPPALWAAFLTYYGGFFVMFLIAFIGATVTAAPPRASTRRRW